MRWVLGGIQLTAFDSTAYDFDGIWDARNRLLENCDTVETVQDIDLGAYAGVLRVGHECGPEAVASLVLFQVGGASDHFASGIIQVVTDDDVDAIGQAITTFELR